MRISDWSSDVCSSDLAGCAIPLQPSFCHSHNNHRPRERGRLAGIRGVEMANYCVPEKGKAALLCISAQRDFVSPGSPVRACGWHSALPNITRLVEKIGRASCRERVCQYV